MKQLTNTSYQYNSTKNEVQEMISKVEVLQKGKQNCSLYIMAMQSKRRLNILDERLAVPEYITETTGYKFKPNKRLLEMLKVSSGLGELSEDSAEPITVTEVAGLSTQQLKGPVAQGEMTKPKVPIAGCESTKSKGPIIGVKHSTDINIRSSSDTEACHITGCVVLPDNQSIVVADWNNYKIKMCSIKKGTVTSKLHLQYRPGSITNIGDKQVAVTVPSKKKILFITTDQVLTIQREMKVNGDCRGVVQCSDGRLIVSFVDPHKVEIMKLDGTFLSTIAKDKKGNYLFSHPFYVTISPDNKTIYVSNWYAGTVVCLRLDGTVIATYNDNQLSNPMQAVIDVDGMVYICGGDSDNIHQVTGDCRKVKVLMTNADGLLHPCSICYSETDGKFYVGMRGNDIVKVFLAVHDRV